MSKVQEFFKSYTDELTNKVTWPTVDELQSTTVTVLVASILIAILVMIADFVYNKGMGLFYGLFQ